VTSGDGFRVGDLDRHIRFVDTTVTTPMRRATEAGRPLDHLAYGLVGQAFAVTVTAAAAIGAHAVAGLADEADGFAAGLRATRDGYEQAERANTSLPGPR